MRLYRRSDRADAAWWFAFSHRGKKIRRSTFTADKEAAQEYADTYRANLWRASKLGQRPSVTWDVAALDWLESHANLRALSDREDHLRWALPHLTGKPLASIDRAALNRLAKKKELEGSAPATVNRYLASIVAVLNHAVEHGMHTSAPKAPKRKEPEGTIIWATQEQAAELVAKLPAHWQPIARFSLATGVRRFNATHLEWSRVNIRRRVAWVNADEAKGEHTLSIPLNDDAIAVLQEQQGQHKQWVFPYRGKPVTRMLDKLWRAACRAAGLGDDFTWHCLRHTWASWHVQRGTPLPVLQQLGGWRSIAMVQRYAHLGASHVAAYAGNSSMKTKRVQKWSQPRSSGRPKKAA